MAENQDHSFRGLKHSTLADLVTKPDVIEKEAVANNHVAIKGGETPSAPVKFDQSKSGKNTKPTLPKPRGQRGRICLFVPGKERVTVVKEKVGQSFEGTWIHEVINREGKKFLASDKQLKELV